MSEGAYKKVGQKLVDRGYAAIPIMPGTKRPGELRRGEWVGKTKWREEYTRRMPTRFEIQLWSSSDAGVCVVCGPGSKYLVGVDIDTDDPTIKKAIIAALPPTTVIKRGAKGETRFFRGPQIENSKSWNIPNPRDRKLPTELQKKFRACDLIGPGRQTLLPPTIHPDTNQPYAWTGAVALEDIDPADLPEITPEHIAAIDAALKPFGFEEEPEFERPAFSGGSTPDHDRPVHRQLNDFAIFNFDKWVPGLGLKRCRKTAAGWEAVAEWRASNGGQPLEKRKFNLKFHRDGIVDFGDGPRNYTPINVVMAAFDLTGKDGLDIAFKWLSDATGWGTGPIILNEETTPPKAQPQPEPEEQPEPEAKPEPERKRGNLVDDGAELPELPVTTYGLSPAISSPVEPLPATVASALVERPKPHRLEALTYCPGVIGDMVEWITATARRPNRVMALGAAVSILGTLIGRRIAGPTRSATHLNVVCLASTGAGKQHPLDCIPLLMRAAGAGNCIGPSQFISMPAVVNMLLRQPLALSAQDEFGAFLKRINARNASSFEKTISQILRQVWGISFGEYMTPEWAGRPAAPVPCPALSIFGMSTPEEFYDGLQSSELKNGFLNRFLLIKTGRTEARTPELEPGRVPDSLAAALHEIHSWGSQLGNARINDVAFRPEPVVLKWASAKAQECFTDLEAHVEKLITKEPEMDWYVARTAEIAIRLATIRAVGRWGPSEGGPSVSLDDVEWGRDIALPCGLQLAKEAKLHMAENDRQAWSNRILELVRKHGQASPRVIQQKVRGALKSAEIKDILEGLCEAGAVEAVRGQQAGRLVTAHYKYVGE